MSLGCFFVSCDKDDDNGGSSSNSCRCTYIDEDGDTMIETLTPKDMEYYGFKNCGDAQRYVQYYGGRNVSCNPA